MFIIAWARTYDIKYLILRPTNNYGVGQYPEKLIPITVKNLMRGKKIKLHDEGEPIRNWLHSDDTATAVIALIESGVTNGIYNVAGNFEQKNIDTVKKIINCYFHKETEVDTFLDLSFRRPGQDVRYALNDKKLRSLGWEPKRNFDVEIKDIVEYYKHHFKW
jgi:dTDP-glucose 4,6-dehydratase